MRASCSRGVVGCALAIILTFLGTQKNLVAGQVVGALLYMAVFGAVISYAMQCASFIFLRRRLPNIERPYRSPMTPGEAVDLLRSETGRFLDPRVVVAMSEVVDEWEERRKREPALRVGKILILTTVAPSGEVTSTRIDKKNVDQSQLGACLKSAARNIHFPSFKGEAFPLDIPVVVAGGE